MHTKISVYGHKEANEFKAEMCTHRKNGSPQNEQR